jgi:hypothetical protein
MMQRRHTQPKPKPSQKPTQLLILCIILCVMLAASATINVNTGNSYNQAQSDIVMLQTQIDNAQTQIDNGNETINKVIMQIANFTTLNQTTINDDYVLIESVPIVHNLLEEQFYSDGTTTVVMLYYPTLDLYSQPYLMEEDISG